MDSISDKLFKVITAEVPYKEESGGFTKYGDWYGENVAKGSDGFDSAAWCDMFLAWAADKAGVADYAGLFAYTPSHATWFKQQGAWTSEPEPGAFVFYDWSGAGTIDGISHVGIVEKVADGKIYTIEGNTEGVHLKRKVRDTDSVVGYGLPRKVKVDGATYEEAMAATAPPAGTPATPDAPVGADGSAVLAGAVLAAALIRPHRLRPRAPKNARPQRDTRPKRDAKRGAGRWRALAGAGLAAALAWGIPASAMAATQPPAPTSPAPASPAPAPLAKGVPLPYGVDVSNHDAGFDWGADGLAFGIAKASEGTGFTDKTFARNWSEIKRNGLVRGAYHFGRPGADPVRQADRFLDTVTKQGLEAGDLLILDLEVTDGRSAKEVNAWAKRWLERVHDVTGVRALFYSSWSFAQTHGDGLGDYPLWVAHYGKEKGEVTAPEPWTSWAIHQYASTDHDHNVARLPKEELRALGYTVKA
ncbi:GH25 family lysozyme [Nonomuraea sp. NBC_01738]|uniref:GH25 family lysozyme n=1 Tax=Nonomuraea sp. NBC_01738 TaxID=2976003 RepID=UPI002E0E76C2|nr:GH25 family lysozyme [Nonomuraea sp. NBC_01738]